MNINPSSPLRIVRQLSDPSDVATYYVQAVVRNSASGTVLETINLTDNGDQRFTGTYQTGPDGSGNGFYIDVTTTVYTDAGYTTKSGNYGIEAETYHVIQAWSHALGGGGGFSPDVNYEKVRQIVQEELGKLEKPEPPVIPDLMPELLRLEQRLTASVGAINIPEQKEVDLEPVLQEVRTSVDNAINTLLLAVDSKEVTPETDLSSVLSAIEGLPNEELVNAAKQLSEAVNTIKEILDTQEDVSQMKQAAEEFMSRVSPRTLDVGKKKEEPQDANLLRARKLLGA